MNFTLLYFYSSSLASGVARASVVLAYVILADLDLEFLD